MFYVEPKLPNLPTSHHTPDTALLVWQIGISTGWHCSCRTCWWQQSWLPLPHSAIRGHLRTGPNPIHLHSPWGTSYARIWKRCTGGQTQKGNYWVGEQSAPGITGVIQVTCNSSHSSKWCYSQCHFQSQDCVFPQLLEMFQLFDNFLTFTLCSLSFFLSPPLFLLLLLFIFFLLFLSVSLSIFLLLCFCMFLSLSEFPNS